MVVLALSLDVRPIACSCKKSYDKVITRVILSHPRTTFACSRAPAAYWRKTVRKILCVCFVQRSLSDASDRACSVRPYFYLQLFLRIHSDQTEFCVSYDFLIASSRVPIVKAPLIVLINDRICPKPWWLLQGEWSLRRSSVKQGCGNWQIWQSQFGKVVEVTNPQSHMCDHGINECIGKVTSIRLFIRLFTITFNTCQN